MIAPGRARRPGIPKQRAVEPPSAEELESCPFCEGREERTPPETLALAAGFREANAPGWQVRVVPNLFPALERQEVVIHTPRHARSLSELADDEVALVAQAWQARAQAHPSYVHAIVNEGASAGASLAHTHSQLFWLAEPPPGVAHELERGDTACALCSPGNEPLLIGERDGVALEAAWAGRAPYELRIAPREHERDPWTSPRLAAALQLVADGLRRLRAVEGPTPVNLWLHAAGHWHIELVPRLSVFAGLELGAEIYLNPLPPEDAAARLRGVSL